MLKSLNALTVVLLILLGFSTVSNPVQASAGNMLRSIFVNPIPPCGYFSAGVAFDGSELLISCVFSNVITRVSPVDGRNLGSLTIDGISASEGITAMSWDAQNRRLWVGSATVIPQKVYTVTLDKVEQRGTATFKFTHTQGSGESWVDGLAFDPTDGTVWLGPDGQTQIYHYTQTGNLLVSFSVAGIARFGKSGIVVGSPTKLYVANDGDSQIFSVNKDGTSPALFANVPAGKRVEDLECDNVTFAPKSVIWSKYSFDNYELNAYEVPDGECFPGARDKVLNVPLFKQGVAPYNDNNPSWERLEYDDGKSQSLWCGTTMAQCGCATTSIAMVLGFYGVIKDPDGNPTTPATVNNYFKQGSKCGAGGCISLGYRYGLVRWGAAADYSAAVNKRFGTQKIAFNGRGTYDADTVRQDINNDRPVILENVAQTHWSAATGIAGHTFTINDPFYSRTRLDDPAYGNDAKTMVRYIKTSSDFSSIEVAALAPAQILVTDQSGRRIGFDPSTGTIVEEIPNSTYVFQHALADDTDEQKTSPPLDAGINIVELSIPQANTYTIEVVSQASQLYSFAVYGSDRDANLLFNLFEGQPAPGEQTTYTFAYDPTPGATTISLVASIDIKPGDASNLINPKSKGVIPVAILSTSNFDAKTVDSLSVSFGTGGASEAHSKGHIEDVNGDGKLDMVLHFSTQQSGIAAGDTQACLTGKTNSDLDIQGCDFIQTVP